MAGLEPQTISCAAASLHCAAASLMPRTISFAPHLAVCCAHALLLRSTGTAAGPFWALHHSVQPPELRGMSIAAINSVGNVGGFVRRSPGLEPSTSSSV